LSAEFSPLLAIAIIAAVTLATRLGGAEIMRYVRLSPWVERFLTGLSTGVLAALIATVIARGGLREAAAIGAAILFAVTTGRPLLAILAAMAVAAGWTAWIG